jgi:hypothetical protein
LTLGSARATRKDPKSLPRLVVAYTNGTWSDRLRARSVRVATHRNEIVLDLEIAGGGRSAVDAQPLRELRDKQHALDYAQLRGRRLLSRLQRELRHTENSVICVNLTAEGIAVSYPASVTLGPDAITLSFG